MANDNWGCWLLWTIHYHIEYGILVFLIYFTSNTSSLIGGRNLLVKESCYLMVKYTYAITVVR
jgi:hypothetical protein